jgi:patatin-like phospholipase/acyl hydrolase
MYKNLNCSKKIESRLSEKISMVEFFDMLAGSETGAILASTLAIKNDDAN